MSMNIRNAGLRAAFAGMLDDGKVTLAEVTKLLEQAQKDGRISGREANDLKVILRGVGDKFDADAKASLRTALGLPDVGGGGDGTPPPVTLASDRVQAVTDFKVIADTFRAEMAARSSVFNTPENAMKLFAEYGGKLKALAAGQDPRAVDTEVEKLLAAGRQTPAAGFEAKDTDFDSINDLKEAAQGRDAKVFDARVMGAESPAWTTTYWPSAGSGDMDQAGSPGSNLWAKEGPLAKLDKLLVARGMQDRAKALEFERKPNLSWLVGDRAGAGHFVPNSELSEADAEMSTGVDFDGDGKLTAGVKVDFLNQFGQFAPVWNRQALVPKLGTETLERRTETDAQGVKTFKFFKAGGVALTPEEAGKVFYANPSSGDGKVDGTMSIGWWGFCDQVALAGILFKEPLRSEVTMDGVTFTKQDMLGLLTVIASSQAGSTDFKGARYDKVPDTITLTTGRKLTGTIETMVDFRTKHMRHEGDIMVLPKVTKDVTIKLPNGTRETFKPEQIAQLTREDQQEMSPMDFHATILKWLGDDKRAAVMDRDAGEHVWNYNFWKATLKEAKELTAAEVPTEPGFHGPADPTNKLVKFDMEVMLGTATTWGNDYRYWLELDSAGKPVNGGWIGSTPPDFMWRPMRQPTFTGYNSRNPYVDPAFVKAIYDKFMEPVPPQP